MSAAATAAGYLYASGRLRGRGKEGEEGDKPAEKPQAKRRTMRVAALPDRNEYPEPKAAEPKKPRAAVKVEYRTRRWRPDAD